VGFFGYHKFEKENCFNANLGHYQPLDVAYFRPLKIHWKKSLLAYKNKHRAGIPKTEFPRVFKNALDRLTVHQKM